MSSQLLVKAQIGNALPIYEPSHRDAPRGPAVRLSTPYAATVVRSSATRAPDPVLDGELNELIVGISSSPRTRGEGLRPARGSRWLEPLSRKRNACSWSKRRRAGGSLRAASRRTRPAALSGVSGASDGVPGRLGEVELAEQLPECDAALTDLGDRGVDYVLAVRPGDQIPAGDDIGLGEPDIPSLTSGQVEERLFTFVRLDSGRQLLLAWPRSGQTSGMEPPEAQKLCVWRPNRRSSHLCVKGFRPFPAVLRRGP